MERLTESGRFTEEFKRSVVLAAESGKCHITDLSALHGIKGHSTILKWCRLYGKRKCLSMKKTNSIDSPVPKDSQMQLLRNQIKALENELKESRFKQATLETLIDIAEEHYSIVIKKNYGGKLLAEQVKGKKM